MDISKYISELLYDHDCVIIPGFGGFVCNYKAAEIHPVINTISPPSKAISFNKNLRSNDGLLLNHIALREQTSFDDAFVSVYGWVGSSNALLQKGEELNLVGIGKLHNNIEGNLIFSPDQSVNYLKSSFGLRTITAAPVVRERTVDVSERPVVKQTKQFTLPKASWRIAAAVLLIGAMVTFLQLMRTGVEIKPLNLDEAGVFNLVSTIFKAAEPELKPFPLGNETPAETPVAVEEIVPAPLEEVTSVITEKAVPAPVGTVKTTATVAPSYPETYYVIVGAFSKKRNAIIAKQRLEEKYPNSEILVERVSNLTRVGFSAGNNYDRAMAQLASSQQEDSSYWLLTK